MYSIKSFFVEKIMIKQIVIKLLFNLMISCYHVQKEFYITFSAVGSAGFQT